MFMFVGKPRASDAAADGHHRLAAGAARGRHEAEAGNDHKVITSQ